MTTIIAPRELPATEVAIFAIAQVATEAYLAVMLGIAEMPTIKENVHASVYWPEFVEAVNTHLLPDDWCRNKFLGAVVAGWARLERKEAA